MRTTIRLDDDVAAAAQRLSRDEHIGLGEAVNKLARAGLVPGRLKRQPFRQRTADLRLTVDVSNVADALELIEGADHS
jgi:Arc/MetJ family transcription regulator